MMKLRPIYARLEEEQYEWLREYCYKSRKSKAQVIREALELYKTHVEKPNPPGDGSDPEVGSKPQELVGEKTPAREDLPGA